MKSIRIIHLENNGIDAELVALALKDQAYTADVVIVDDKERFCKKLETEKFDVILMDYDVPNLSASEAIDIVKSKKIDTPIIVISGAIGYDSAIRLIKQGAQDYVLKQNLISLPSVIHRALNETQQKADGVKQKKEKATASAIIHTGIFKMNQKGNCLSVNKPLCEMLGYSEKEIMTGDGWLKYIVPDTKELVTEKLLQQLRGQAPFEIEAKLITGASQEIWVKCNYIPEGNGEFLGAMVDVTTTKSKEDELVNLSMHDALTSLPNRRYFSEAVQMMIHECERGVLNAFAVFYIDLDHFKKVNDLLGHPAGDELLKQAAARFKSIVRKYDIIARIGGDEFLIVFKHINSIGEIAFLCDTLLTKFRVPFYIGEHECLTTLSIGVAYVDNTTTGIDAESIIQKADQALYRSKARGRNCYEIYTDNISHEIQHTIFIENALRHAIDEKELSIVFQPQIDLLKSAIFGFETLVRWRQAVYGDIPPNIFVPIAEESQQINVIGEWVIDSAIKAYQQFDANVTYFKKHGVSLSVNISAIQLLQNDFIDHLLQKIKLNKINPQKFIFEITETGIIQNMSQLKNQFIRSPTTDLCIAVDDFGTGYSSFTNLKELPIKVLKIDQSFVQEIENDANCRNIIKSVISLANAMQITLIAEGVETQKQVDFLLENGCSILQGYFFSKPLALSEVEDYIRNFGAVRFK
ncbi:MAG TPA: GGDEF domain-containing response regulator [Coxiellaceae bacterium]|nr:MAG: hypothetical protein A3E81_06455 [Gammaproteobacteria bacterium RIFCSPHIGHO2_12_FULL_36_30]HLB56811.1 GGDEF domain-containing response regulator [Coxiellaceae bacterium]